MPDSVMPPEAMERPSLKNLAAALAKAQSEMEGAKKDVTNPHFKSKYADLASVWDAIRGPLTKNGLSVVQLLRSIQGGVEVETILLHSSGERIGDVFAVPASKADAQGYGSAATYARRYSLMALVGVAPEEDDGNAASHGVAGMASGGGDFRPAGPRKFVPPTHVDGVRQASRNGAQMAADEPESLARANGRKKGELLPAGQPTPEEARAAKIKAGADQRINALKAKKEWLRPDLDQFWTDNKKWIDWMSDPNNEALKEYERFTDAFADAEMNSKPVELA